VPPPANDAEPVKPARAAAAVEPQARLPDDPGPDETEEPVKKRRFRLFS